jgi:hypothetical protein
MQTGVSANRAQTTRQPNEHQTPQRSRGRSTPSPDCSTVSSSGPPISPGLHWAWPAAPRSSTSMSSPGINELTRQTVQDAGAAGQSPCPYLWPGRLPRLGGGALGPFIGVRAGEEKGGEARACRSDRDRNPRLSWHRRATAAKFARGHPVPLDEVGPSYARNSRTKNEQRHYGNTSSGQTNATFGELAAVDALSL